MSALRATMPGQGPYGYPGRPMSLRDTQQLAYAPRPDGGSYYAGAALFFFFGKQKPRENASAKIPSHSIPRPAEPATTIQTNRPKKQAPRRPSWTRTWVRRPRGRRGARGWAWRWAGWRPRWRWASARASKVNLSLLVVDRGSCGSSNVNNFAINLSTVVHVATADCNMPRLTKP